MASTTTTETTAMAGRLRLMQLVSPALPVGAYAYSQGQEHAVHAGWVHDEASAGEWILGLLGHTLARLDVPVLARLYGAWEKDDRVGVQRWTAFLYASRESGELRQEDRHIGQALARLLVELDVCRADPWRQAPQVCFATMFSLAAVEWSVPLNDTLAGYLWSWCENQVAAAIKSIPLGQTAGQRILSRATVDIARAVEQAMGLSDEEIGAAAPAFAIGSALHETQYSRLFRS